MSERLKILVFDDSEINRRAAEAQLTEYDTTIVGTYDEAQELIATEVDYHKVYSVLNTKFGDYRALSDKRKKEYDNLKNELEEENTHRPDFDVVLTDLLVPPSRQAQGHAFSDYRNDMPVGIFIGLLGAKNGAKYVAIVTDSSHHDHPASACFDVFNKSEDKPSFFTIGNTKCILVNNRKWVGQFDKKNLAVKLNYTEYKNRTDTVTAKNWKEILKYLLAL